MEKLKLISSSFALTCEDDDNDNDTFIKKINKCIEQAINTSLNNINDFQKIPVSEYISTRKYKNQIIDDFNYEKYIEDNINKYYQENKLEYKLLVSFSQCTEIMESYYCYNIVYIDK